MSQMLPLANKIVKDFYYYNTRVYAYFLAMKTTIVFVAGDVTGETGVC
jgi:hypothetical protein